MLLNKVITLGFVLLAFMPASQTLTKLTAELQLSTNHLVTDESPPIIMLRDTSILVKNHWTISSIVESVMDDSDFYLAHTIEELDDKMAKICIVATDEFFHTSMKCQYYTLIEIDHPLLGQYYSDNLENTIHNYLKLNQIPLENIGFSYRNLEDSASITINADLPFKAASSIKFPLGVIIYDYIQQGLIQKNETMIYQKRHNVGGTTLIPRYFHYGDAIPIQTLLKYMLVYSDNNATQMLFDRLSPFGKWQNIMTDFYGVPNDSIQVIGNIVTADYMMKAIDYVLHHKDQYEELIHYLSIAYPKRYLKKYLDEIPMLHKCGFHAGNINDVGVVFGNNPYAIVILTRQLADAEHHIGTLNALIHAYLSFQDHLDKENEDELSSASLSATVIKKPHELYAKEKYSYFVIESK